MINGIINGIAEVLDNTFGITIYSEKIKQGFCEPCFFIQNLSAEQKPLLGDRFSQSYFFDVHYFPKESNQINLDMQNTALRLYDVLEYVTGNTGGLRGRNMHHEVVDDVLHFFIEYEAHGCREKDKIPHMQDLKTEGRVSNDGGKGR